MKHTLLIAPLQTILLRLVATWIIMLTLSACNATPVQPEATHAETNVTRNLIIHYDASHAKSNKQRILDAASTHGADVVYQLDNLNIVVIRVPDRISMTDAITYVEHIPGVLGVNRDQIHQLQTTTQVLQ
jgi:hypothetical protein